MQDLIDNVIDWAEARNLIEGSTPLKQVDKTSEEVNELVAALAIMDYEAGFDEGEPEAALPAAADAIGDITVTLIVIAAQLGLDFKECLAGAYDEIKDRKGTVVNGKFVKESI